MPNVGQHIAAKRSANLGRGDQMQIPLRERNSDTGFRQCGVDGGVESVSRGETDIEVCDPGIDVEIQ